MNNNQQLLPYCWVHLPVRLEVTANTTFKIAEIFMELFNLGGEPTSKHWKGFKGGNYLELQAALCLPVLAVGAAGSRAC